MLVVKISAVLVAYALLLCHAHRSQAAPTSSRSGLDSISLSDLEVRRLLNAILREFVQMSAEEEQDATSREHPLLSKRCSGLSTCVLGKLSQDLHKLQTFPRTNVGAGTPGRKRSALSNLSYQNLEREAEHGGVLGTLGTLGMLGQRFSLDQD